MSTVKHVPVETAETDGVGTVRLCDCCRRPWVYRKLPTPFGPVQKFMGQTVLVWTPETLRERVARRWWQFKATFKRTQEQKDADDRAERRAAELRRGGQSDPMWVTETTTTETYHPVGRKDVTVTKNEPETFPYVPRADETVVSEEMRKKVWEE